MRIKYLELKTKQEFSKKKHKIQHTAKKTPTSKKKAQ